jgi:hypothetical protein
MKTGNSTILPFKASKTQMEINNGKLPPSGGRGFFVLNKPQ